MKNIITCLCIATLFIGCTDDAADTPVAEQNSHMQFAEQSSIRTPKEALEIAQRAISMIDEVTPVSRSTRGRHIDFDTQVQVLTTSCPTVARAKSRTEGNVGTGVTDTLMYVVNFADNMGFALVSAPRMAPDLIAVTVAGNYNPAESTENNGFNLYMECAAQYLQDCLEQSPNSAGINFPDTIHIKPMPYDYIVQDTIWHKRIPNRVKVFWGQHNPEGEFCPNKTSGCSITALAMLLSGYGYPNSILLTYYDNSRIALDWDKLRLHNSFDRIVGSNGFVSDVCWREENYNIHTVLSHLCRELGFRSNTEYLDSGDSPTLYTNVMNTLSNLGGFTVLYRECSAGSIKDDMDMNTILLMRGKNSEGKGHMWVCDAVKSYHFHYRWYRGEGLCIPLPGDEDEPNLPLYKEWDDAGGTYNFFNWGIESQNNMWHGSEVESNGDKCGYFYDLDFGKYGTEVGYIKVRR